MSEEAKAKLRMARLGTKQSAETVAKRAEKLRGKPIARERHEKLQEAAQSDEARAKRSASLMGHENFRPGPYKDEWKLRVREGMEGKIPVGSDSHSWRGGEVGYVGAHMRHAKVLSRYCESCGSTEPRLACALRPDAPEEHLRIDNGCYSGRAYSVFSEDYSRLCNACHCRQDFPARHRIKERDGV